METVTFKVKKKTDLRLLVQLAKRLGISIVEEPTEENQKKWSKLGKLNLGKELDQQNIRDFAND